MDLEISELYNLNIINLNKLLKEKISVEIDNFLYENNLKDISKSSKDYNKIFKHFFIKNLIDNIKINYDNIFVLQKDEKDLILTNFSAKIIEYIKTLNLNLYIFDNENIDDSNDLNYIYKFKTFLKKKKKPNLKKIQTFFEKNELTYLTDKLKNSMKIKMLLHK
jgi:hypothetical protein